MDDGVIIVLDYEKICRLCLQTKGVMSDIFDKDEDEPLTTQIKLITTVEISVSDSLPKKICHKCRYMVELSYDLRSTVLKSNQLLCESTDMDMERLTQALDRSLQQADYQLDGRPFSFTLQEEEQPEDEDEYELREGKIVKSKKSDKKDDNVHFGSVISISDDSWHLSGARSSGPGMNSEDTAQEVWAAEEQDEAEQEGEGEGEEYRSEEGEGSQVMTDADDSVDWKSVIGKRKSKGYEYDELTCQLCLEVFSGIHAHMEHVDEHYRDFPELVPFHRSCKPFTCMLCPGQTFSFRKDLIIHHRVHLKINPYFCEVSGCGCFFKSKEALRHHMYSHADKKFVCEVCGSAFRRKFELGQHKVRHLDEGSLYTCKLCRVVCKNRLSFKAHTRHHETGRRFKCNRSGCPKAFFSNTDLSIHERAHSNNKCYKCPLCVCAYISQSQLNRHLRQHEKRRVNKCDKCSESFTDYTEFCNHRIKTHGEWHPHKCPACNQGYQGSRQLERHISRCRLATKLGIQGRSQEEEGLAEDGEVNPLADIHDLNMTDVDVSSFKTEDQMGGLEVVMQAADLQHLTTADSGVCDGNFLYIETTDLGDGAGESGAEGGDTQYMIIKDGQEHEFFAAVQEATIKKERDEDLMRTE